MLVKVILANLWTIIGIALSIIGSLLSFVIGNSIGLVLGRLIHTAAVLALIWLAFRMIRGKNSAITKGVERLGGRVLVAVGRAMLQLGSAFFRWITTRSSDSPKGGRS